MDNHPSHPIHEFDSINYVQEQSSPRFIKSHLPLELLPTVVNSDCKVRLYAYSSDFLIKYINISQHIFINVEKNLIK